MSENKEFDKNTPSIHTLESDLASAVRDENYGKNIIKIVTDPAKNSLLRNPEEGSGEKNKIDFKSFLTKRNILVTSVFIFLLASAISIFYILNKAKNVEEGKVKEDTAPEVIATTTPEEKPIIKGSDMLNPEVIQAVDFSKSDRAGIIAGIAQIRNDLAAKKIQSYTNIGIDTNLRIEEFLLKIRYSGDQSLIGTFDSPYSLGLYSTKDGRFETYLLVKINNFDLAFKSILDWEKYMPIDFKDIFPGNNEVLKNESLEDIATTSTSTVAKEYVKKNTNGFIDRTLKNYDIREYVNNENNVDLIYGFINSKYLLITSGESSFIDVKDRLLKNNILR